MGDDASPTRAPAFTDPEATYEDAPSREDLLKRAAELGPRQTWQSIVLSPTDPILGQKMQPRVRERRERLRRFVKVTIGACVAFCVFVLGASVFSENGFANAATSAGPPPKMAPAAASVSIEKLDMPLRGKASGSRTAATMGSRPAVATTRATWMKRR
jgi:hypothetical protein